MKTKKINILKKISKFFEEEKPESKIQKLIDKAREEYPEIFMNDRYRDILTLYRQLKHMEREKWYFVAICILTLSTVFIAWQNLQLQKPNFVRIVGQNCPDEFYGYVSYSFSFANIGKSSGNIIVGYKNNNSATIDFNLYNTPNEDENPISLFVRDGDSVTYNIMANPFQDKEFFNFTIHAETLDWCKERTCSYKRYDNNPSHFEKIGKDQWVDCAK